MGTLSKRNGCLGPGPVETNGSGRRIWKNMRLCARPNIPQPEEIHRHEFLLDIKYDVGKVLEMLSNNADPEEEEEIDESTYI